MFRSGGGTQCVGGMDGSPAAAVVVTTRPRVRGEKGEGSGVPERRRQSSSSWRLPRAATPSPHASTPTPRAAAPSPRAPPAFPSRSRRVWVSGDGGVASGGSRDLVLDLPRWGSILGQNEKAEIEIGSKSIPGQMQTNSKSGAYLDWKRSILIRRIGPCSGPIRPNRTRPKG
jgi:hypothetical protein